MLGAARQQLGRGDAPAGALADTASRRSVLAAVAGQARRQLHDDLVWWIEHRLDELAKLERDGNTDELHAHSRQCAINAIPGPMMRTLWRLLLTGRVKSPGDADFDLYRWRGRFKRDGLTTTLRMELRELLTPRVSMREPFRWPRRATTMSASRARIRGSRRMGGRAIDGSRPFRLARSAQGYRWTAALPDLLCRFQCAVARCAGSDARTGGRRGQERPVLCAPTLDQRAPAEQALPRLDGLDRTDARRMARHGERTRPSGRRLAAEIWWQTPYPLFRRLAYFAAAQGKHRSPSASARLALADDQWWLWSVRNAARSHATAGGAGAETR